MEKNCTKLQRFVVSGLLTDPTFGYIGKICQKTWKPFQWFFYVEFLGASPSFNSHDERISASNDPVDHVDKIVGSGCDSDVSQDDLSPIANMEKSSKLQMGHNSQHEDGELNESIECTLGRPW